MRPIHVRLLATGAGRDAADRLAADLRAAGHRVSTAASDTAPVDFVLVDAAAQPTPESLAAAEARHLRAVLDFTGGNRRQAALLLGVARSTLLAKLRRHGMD
jgi:DNA-binding NtrC family response regulator